jgi:hypothetical protein
VLDSRLFGPSVGLVRYVVYADGMVITQRTATSDLGTDGADAFTAGAMAANEVAELLEVARHGGMTSSSESSYGYDQVTVTDQPVRSMTVVSDGRTYRNLWYTGGDAPAGFTDAVHAIERLLDTADTGDQWVVSSWRAFVSRAGAPPQSEAQPPIPFEVTIGANGAGCAVIDATALSAVRQNTGSGLFSSDRGDVNIVAEAILPGETGCPS